MKRLFYPPPIRELLMVFLLLIVGNLNSFGEGSKDFWNYEGFRLFYLIADASPELTNEQQLKAYAAEGEYINVGSSHVGIAGGFITVYRPDGTIHTTFDGSNGMAIINNDVEELAGPTGGTGYIPGVIEVTSGQAGIWSVVLDYPTTQQSSGRFDNLSNGEAWTRAANQPTNGRVALAWDVTVSQNAAGNMGGRLLEGRVYSNEYISIVNNTSPDNVVNATSPTFYLLTRSGFQYKVDFIDSDPWGFPLFSNSMGIVNGDRKATYQSLDRADYTRSTTPNSWTANNNYLYHPQAEDMGLLWNNKIFFNTPDASMPTQATVTDVINGNNTHTTWLYTPVASDNVGQNAFGFNGDNPQGDAVPAKMQVGQGGNFAYASQVGGIAQLQLDLNNNGSYSDAVDRVIVAEAILGDGNAIFWDGVDGAGNVIPANPNFEFNYNLSIRGGEVHILMDDVENLEGVDITRINGVNSPAKGVYYDHTGVGGAVSGGGTAGSALATTDLFAYDNNFGDTKLLDYWSFVEANNFGSGAIALAVVADLNAQPPVALSGIDTDGDGVDDAIDLDDDNDGILDADEISVARNNGDTDQDGVPDHFDLDSDNDGLKDAIENDNPDPDGDGRIGNGAVTVNADGIVISDADGTAIVYNPEFVDPDGPGKPDHIDLDSNNDGVFDAVAAGFPDPDNDGQYGTSPVMVDVNGCVLRAAAPGPDNDNDGIPDDIDLDDDNDGISDVAELAAASANGDTDGDGIPDVFDLDSDNDGISDLIEAGHGQTDSNGDGVIDGAPASFGQNGLFNNLASSADGLNAVINYTPVDWDGDGVADHIDLDSDNDGIYDVVEVSLGGSDTNNDGRIDSAVDANGITTIVSPVDTDGDGVGDWHDWDTDNDGIHDVVENLNADADGDGIIGTGTPTVNANGVVITGGLTYNPNVVNTDNTGGADFRDLDSDGDGILDVAEAGLPDGDGNGILGTGTPSINIFGVPSAPDANGNTVSSISNPRDTDGNGTPDFQEQEQVVQCTAANTPVLGAISAGDLCSGSSAIVSVSGATNFAGPVNFTWTGPNGFTETGRLDNVNTVYQITVANAGTYSLSVTTDDGCTSAPVSATVNVTTGPTASIGGTSGAICSTDNIQLTATDLGGGTTYEWFRDGVSLGSTNTPAFNAGSQAGSYTVVAAQNGCSGAPSSASVISISAPPAVGIGGTAGNLCTGDNIQLTATPLAVGTTYSWYRNGQFIVSTTDPSFSIPGATSADNGDYSVAATQNGCIGGLSSAASISIGTGPNASIGGTTGDICSGTNIDLTATDLGAGTTYDWFRDGVSIGSTNEPRLVVGAATEANTGGYTVIASQNGCAGVASAVSTINVSASSQIESAITVDNAFLCQGDDFLITANEVIGDAMYIWYLNGAEFARTTVPMITVEGVTIANTGAYSVEVTQGACTSVESSSVSLEVGGGFITTTLSTANPNICAGGSTTLTATSAGEGYTYEWYLNDVLVTTTTDPSLNINTATAANAGNYTVIPTRSTCPGSVSNAIALGVSNTPTAGAVTTTNANPCSGETLALTTDDLGAGVAYNWYQNGQLVSTTDVPSYSVVATAGAFTMIPSLNGCEGASSNAVDVTIGAAGTAPTIASSVASLCAGEMATLTATGGDAGATYEWFNGATSLGTSTDPTFAVTGGGSYTVTTTGGACGGGTSSAVDIAVTEGTVPTIASSVASLCAGEMATLTATGGDAGATYEWFNGATSLGTSTDPTFAVTGGGSYTVTTTGGVCGGGTSSAVDVAVIEGGVPTITADIANLCAGEMATLMATGADAGVTYEWFNGATSLGTSTDPTFVVTGDGSYTVTTTGACGGTSNEVAIGLNPTPTEAARILDIPTLSCNETSTRIEAVSPTEGTGTWTSTDPNVVFASPNSAVTDVSGLDATSVLTWTLTGPCGVYDSANTTVTVDQGRANFIPDVITPNGDGMNDAFEIPCSGPVGMKIFNRWGDKVFETDRYNNDWRGTHDGANLPPGPYYYIMDDGSNDKKTGCIAISRDN